MERLALFTATLCYLFGFAHTLFALGAGKFRPGRFNLAAVALGAVAQGWWLSMRGAAEHSCPIANLPEILIFLSWAIALLYLVVGPAYRLSLMGAFTAPLLLILQIAALLLPDERRPACFRANPWVETHAALSLIAYGAFGLACIAGLMFLVQEGQLKSRRPAEIFHHLPPISALADAIRRLAGIGFLLLTLSFVAGFLAHLGVAGGKFWASLLIWLLYGAILAGAWSGRLAGRRFASAVAATFLLALILLPLIQQLSTKH